MSIKHNVELGTSDPDTNVVLNVVGLDKAEKNASDVNGALFAYDRRGNEKFTCRLTLGELQRLHAHLSNYSIIVDHSKERTGRFVEVAAHPDKIAADLKRLEAKDLVPVLQDIDWTRLSPSDVNTILGRKEALGIFQNNLHSRKFTELAWESFFKENDWIFGYGLQYRYLRILQTQAHVSNTDLKGRNSVTSDVLLADRRFTKIVELKRPDTPLFRAERNRADTWGLSKELFDAVSQILAQQVSWELKGQSGNYVETGERIEQDTLDVECILVFGSLHEMVGSTQEKEIKKRTFELFRRNLRNLEIVTYDELLDRAKFIVEGANDEDAVWHNTTASRS